MSAGQCAGARHPEHDLSGFTCGVPELDDWLKRQVLEKRSEPSIPYVRT
jgi:hypothetical protein